MPRPDAPEPLNLPEAEIAARRTREVTFREADVKRVIKAVEAAGFKVGELEVLRDGTIRVRRAGSSAAVDPLKEWEL